MIKITQPPNFMYARLPLLEDSIHVSLVLIIVDLIPSKDVFNIVASENTVNTHFLMASDDAGSFIQKHFIADDRHNLPPSFDEDYIKEITIFIPLYTLIIYA